MKILFKFLVFLVILGLVALFVPFPPHKRVPTPQYNVADLKFGPDFFWGTATSAHQVEGNANDDFTQWEKDNAGRLASEAEGKLKNSVPNWDAIKAQASNPNNYISGLTDDQYNRYPEDIALMKQLGVNSYRFSIDWSRVEPAKGQFDAGQLAHYQTEIQALKAAGIEPFVTLWHRTDPIWVASQGGWESADTITDYNDYVNYVATALNGDVKYWMTFNEPMLLALSGYIQGNLPPQVKSFSRATKVIDNVIAANNKAYTTIHGIRSDSMVASTQAMQVNYGSPNTVANNAISIYLNDYANWKFLDGTKDSMDFVGIQYYGPTLFSLTFGGSTIVNVKNFQNTKAKYRSDTGVEIYPEGIYELITEAYKRYKKPIIITENGIADTSDSQRAQYISDHLYWVHKAASENIPVLGYFYWSLLDNYEWDSGFWPQFGLIHVDYSNNLARTLRPSAQVYKQIIGQSQ